MDTIEWILLVTDNYTASLEFYTKKLDLAIVREIPEEEFCQFKLSHGFLAIYGRKFLEKVVGKEYLGKAGGAIYSFPESKDVDAEYMNLRAKGIPFIKELTTQPWGQRTAYFTDPDGHLWEIQQWVK